MSQTPNDARAAESTAARSAPSRPRTDLSTLRIERGPAKRTRGWIGWAVLLALVVGSVALVLGPLRSTLFPVRVRTATVTRVQSTQGHVRTTASGYVVARTRAAISSRLSGRLEVLYVDVGDAVEAGQLLGQLGHDDLKAAVAEAEAGVAQAQARIAVAERMVAASEAGTAAARSRLGQARAGVRAAEEAHAEAKRVLTLEEGLLAGGSSSPDAVEARRSARDIAEAEVLVARAGVASAAAEVTRVESETAVRRAEIATARAAEAAARAALQRAEAFREDADIRAPFAGIVLQKEAEVGEMVAPVNSAGSTTRGAIVTIADYASLEMEVDVIERDIAKVTAGLPCRIVLDSAAAPYSGRVRQVVPTADKTRGTVQVKITFDALDAGVLPEMSGRVEFLDANAADIVLGADRVLIDERALAAVPDTWTAFVVRDGVVTRVTVEVSDAATEDGRRVVTAGLSGGEEVVIDPPATLEDGDAIAVESE